MVILRKSILFLMLFLGVLKTFSGSLDNNILSKNLNDYYTLKKQEQIDKEIRRRLTIIEAIAYVESRNNPSEYNKKEKAIGYLQIRPIMIKEINQYTNYSITIQECWNKDKSIEAFIAFQNRFNPKWDTELVAKLWNGGRCGHKKSSTNKYWKKVKKKIENL